MKTCKTCLKVKELTDFYKHSRSCKKCVIEKASKWAKEHREEHNRKGKEYRQKHPEKEKARSTLYAKNHPEIVLARVKRYQKKHKELVSIRSKQYRLLNKDKISTRFKKYKKENRAKFNYLQMARKARLLSATPSWGNKFFMEEAYDLAKRRSALKTGGHSEWHVDHIVPLKSDLVCGLHVEHNLRVVPALHNLAKGNRHWPDMPTGV